MKVVCVNVKAIQFQSTSPKLIVIQAFGKMFTWEIRVWKKLNPAGITCWVMISIIKLHAFLPCNQKKCVVC